VKASANKPAKKAAGPVLDDYVPNSGNFGYRVARYDLDLTYKVTINRLSGSVTIIAVTLATLRTFTLDLSPALTVGKVLVNGKRPAHFGCYGGKLHVGLASELPAGAELVIAVRYGGSPRPIRSLWGYIGFEELSDGVLVAGQPHGAPSWFPCDDHPSAKAAYRIRVSTDRPYTVIANGTLVSRQVRAAQTVWTYDQPEPTSTYLVTLQIGRYETVSQPGAAVPMRAALPARLRRNFDHDFGRQPEMAKLFVELFGPYPFSSGYTVVVTDDNLEIPLEAQGVSIFGANYCDGTRSHERLVAHELAHQWFGDSVTVRQWRDIWLHEGFATYAEWLWSEHSGGPSADTLARRYQGRLRALPQDLLLADPGPRDMFDNRVYKRGALTLHALRGRLGDQTFFALLQDWTTRYRHATVVTHDFTALAADYADESLQPLWDAWLYSTAVP
jgi:aminopeptidase N